MKKTSLLSSLMLLAAAATCSAQNSLVKEAEQQLKGVTTYPEYTKVVEALKPAFTNAETANSATTYFVPGKAGFAIYDKYIVARAVGQTPDPKDVGNALLDGYDFFIKAFQYDSLPDAKGKVKPKYSKDMVNIIVGHVNDFDQAAVGFWQAQDFDGAYRAWDALLDIPSNPRYAKSNIRQYPDSIVAEIRYNQGLAAWQAKKLDKAIEAFDKSMALGSNNEQLYEYAYSVAYQAGDSVRMQDYAERGLKKFGTKNPHFLQWTVNGYILKGQYDNASSMLKEAIANEPDNADYLLSYGILMESQKKNDEAKQYYQKAISINPSLAAAYLAMGRILAEEYDALDQATPSDISQADYNKYAATTLTPLLKESAANFEKAYELNSELTDALRYLKNIYYRLNDSANLERVSGLLQ